MCEEYAGPVKTYKRLGIEQLHLPTVDHVEPSFEDLQVSSDTTTSNLVPFTFFTLCSLPESRLTLLNTIRLM